MPAGTLSLMAQEKENTSLEEEDINQSYETLSPENTAEAQLEWEESVDRSNEMIAMMAEEDEVLPTLNGIDISHWQYPINISAIDCDFIIVKATGGKGFLDPSFHNYARQILNDGKLFGFYHFARDYGYQGSAKEEAEFFYSQTKEYIGLGVPVLDWESDLYLGVDWVIEFLNRYYELSGVKCVVYMSAFYTRQYDWSVVANAGYKLWVAQYADYNNVEGFVAEPWRDTLGNGAFDTVLMHQYTSKGKLEGYEGDLDLDIFYGTKEDWTALTVPSDDIELIPPVSAPEESETDQENGMIYRIYNPNSGEHLFTADQDEYNYLATIGWKAEGEAWKNAGTNEVPVYRVYNPNAGDHHYTASIAEAQYLETQGWRFEGICWYTSQKGNSVYRLYNPNAIAGAHHFTLSAEERDWLVSVGWKYEGVSFYTPQ